MAKLLPDGRIQVEPGDTLSKIAQQFLGSAGRYGEISGFRSGNPNLIYPGEVLTVPGVQAPQGAAPAATTPSATISPVERADQSILDAYTELVGQRNTRFADYERQKGPFSLDEVLVSKRAEAGEQVDPYYNELLGDYLTGVKMKRERSVADTQDLLGELTATEESFTGSERMALTEAKNRAAEGFADAGLFNSGSRFRNEGLADVESQGRSEDFFRQSGLRRTRAETGLSRTLADLGFETKGRERDIARERYTETENLASRLARESGQRYVSEFQQTLPPELQGNTGFDLLKSIGIYS